MKVNVKHPKELRLNFPYHQMIVDNDDEDDDEIHIIMRTRTGLMHKFYQMEEVLIGDPEEFGDKYAEIPRLVSVCFEPMDASEFLDYRKINSNKKIKEDVKEENQQKSDEPGSEETTDTENSHGGERDN